MTYAMGEHICLYCILNAKHGECLALVTCLVLANVWLLVALLMNLSLLVVIVVRGYCCRWCCCYMCWFMIVHIAARACTGLTNGMPASMRLDR